MVVAGQKKKRIGERLIELGALNEEQLQIGLQEQRRTGEILGKVLLNLGFVTESEITLALAEELDVPVVKLSEENIDPAVVLSLDKEFAKEKRFVPIRAEGGEMVVAMADPYDLVVQDTIEKQLGMPLRVVATTNEDINNCLDKFFSEGEYDASVENTLSQAADAKLAGPGAAATGGDAPIVALVNQLIMKGVKDRATDIHFEPEERTVRIRYRVDGILQQGTTLPKELQGEISSRIKIMADLDIAEKRRPQDGQITMEREGREIDLRVSLMPVLYGEACVMRILDKKSVSLGIDTLGFDDAALNRFKNCLDAPFGIILVTGPTGSGKTTTLYSALKCINALETCVLTLEDPVEFAIPFIRQSQVQTDIGFTFAAGLRAMLRQDPDVIMVGELRDQETAEIAIRCAMTGHLVLGTLHTNSALDALPRLVDMGVDRFLIASCLLCVQAQRLVRKICKACQSPYQASEYEKDFLGVAHDEPLSLFKGEGCEECNGSGYRGRTCIIEVIDIDDKLRGLTQSGLLAMEELKNHVKGRGLWFMGDHGKMVINNGITTVQEVMRVATGGH